MQSNETPAKARVLGAKAPSETMSERAYQYLRADVIAGVLAPGQKLRLQSLQQRYELGISPIREALMQLSGEGLISNDGQRGFSVSPLSKEDLLDLMHARTAIETLLLQDAIEHGDDDWGAGLAAAYYKLTRARLPQDPNDLVAVELWETAHRGFHAALLSAARSKWLMRIGEQLIDHSERYRRIRLAYPSSPQQLADDVLSEHAQLMEAALDRNAGLACELLRSHLMRTAQVLAERFAE
ncbi:FCD domain-containing protein [uncultured Pigmentiphaga sp.]|jgi:Transcriptional regulators|uniref:FCD domain-containing protein n=1 Tax=uncultured Pigmentiphaga sp. TaxID=340361 RepID=UPI00261B48EF|nr:FCD domain-containing protein [uncultured Pigmentiphaga sp.]